MSPARKAFWYIIAATLIWSLATIILKLGLSEIPPASFTFLRFVIASVLVTTIVVRQKNIRIEAADVGHILILGLLLSFHIVLILYALTLTKLSTLIVLMSLGPLIISTIAVWMLHERVTTRFFVGIMVALVGTLILVLKPDQNSLESENQLLGYALALISLLFSSFFTIYSKKILHKYSPLTLMSLAFPVAAIGTLPFLFFEVIQYGNWVANVTAKGWFSLLYGGIFSSLIAYIFYEMGVRNLKAFKVGVIGFLEPILATAFAVIFLKETITTVFMMGAFLVLIGVATATLHLPHHRHNSHKY